MVDSCYSRFIWQLSTLLFGRVSFGTTRFYERNTRQVWSMYLNPGRCIRYMGSDFFERGIFCAWEINLEEMKSSTYGKFLIVLFVGRKRDFHFTWLKWMKGILLLAFQMRIESFTNVSSSAILSFASFSWLFNWLISASHGMMTDFNIKVLSCAFLISSSRFSFSCAKVDWFDVNLSRNDRDIVAITLSLNKTHTIQAWH